MRIAVDIDGVLNDYENYIYIYGIKHDIEHADGKGFKNPHAYYTNDIFYWNEEQDKMFWDEHFIKTVTTQPARVDASEVIKKLRVEGNEIYIVTARSDDEMPEHEQGKLLEYTTKWLNSNNIEFDKIFIGQKDKGICCLENKVDLFIEDRDKYINDVSKHIPVLCFDAEYNRSCEGKNITRVYSWYDVYRVIK